MDYKAITLATKTVATDIRVVHSCGLALYYDQARQQFIDNGRIIKHLCPCCWKPLKLADCRDLEGVPIGAQS